MSEHVEIFKFDFAPMKTDCPKGFTVFAATKYSLILDRKREGFHERYCVVKTDIGDIFSIFRTNMYSENSDCLTDMKKRIYTGPLNKTLAMLGYKTGALTA